MHEIIITTITSSILCVAYACTSSTSSYALYKCFTDCMTHAEHHILECSHTLPAAMHATSHLFAPRLVVCASLSMRYGSSTNAVFTFVHPQLPEGVFLAPDRHQAQEHGGVYKRSGEAPVVVLHDPDSLPARTILCLITSTNFFAFEE